MKYARNDIFSNPGNPIHTIYSPIVDEKGNVELEVSGYENTDEIIQSFAESCDLNVIIQRYLNGEVDVLEKHKGFFGDASKFPKTYAEVLQMQIDSKNLFESLPKDIRYKFDNDPNKFFVSAGSKEWYDILEPLMNKPYDNGPIGVEQKESEVKESE